PSPPLFRSCIRVPPRSGQPAPTLTRRGAAPPREASMADLRPVLDGLSSMATRQVLGALASGALAAGQSQVRITSVGGVDAEKRVMDGEPVDLVWLAAPALERLEAAGHLVPGSRRALMRSEIRVAARADAPRAPVADEAPAR